MARRLTQMMVLDNYDPKSLGLDISGTGCSPSQSRGCSDGSPRLRRRTGELVAGSDDALVTGIEGFSFVTHDEESERRNRSTLLLDLAVGPTDVCAPEGANRVHFVTGSFCAVPEGTP